MNIFAARFSVTVAGILILFETRTYAEPPGSTKPIFQSIPWELQYGCLVTSTENDGLEDELKDRLLKGKPTDQVRAATTLWEGRSRRYCRDVLEFIKKSNVDVPSFRTLQKQINASLTPQAILKEMEEGDLVWAIWLAVQAPSEEFVPELLANLRREFEMPATLLALGKTRDKRAFLPLIKRLYEKDEVVAGAAAHALGDLGFPEAEKDLLTMLDHPASGRWCQWHICDALGKVGSPQVIVPLSRFAEDQTYLFVIDVQGAAMGAIVAIERRYPKVFPSRISHGEVTKLATISDKQLANTLDLAFSDNGNYLGTVHSDQKIHVWDINKKTCFYSLETDLRVDSIRGLVNDDFLIVGEDKQGTVLSIVRAKTRRIANWKKLPKDSSWSLVSSKDAQLFAYTDSMKSDIVFWEAETGREARTDSKSDRPLCFDPKRLTALIGTESGDMEIWDVSRGKRRSVLQGNGQPVWCAAISSDDQFMATGTDWRVTVWDRKTNKPIGTYRSDSRIQSVDFTSDGKKLIIADTEGPIRIWDHATKTCSIAAHSKAPARLSRDGRLLATSSVSGESIYLWDPNSAIKP